MFDLVAWGGLEEGSRNAGEICQEKVLRAEKRDLRDFLCEDADLPKGGSKGNLNGRSSFSRGERESEALVAQGLRFTVLLERWGGGRRGRNWWGGVLPWKTLWLGKDVKIEG